MENKDYIDTGFVNKVPDYTDINNPTSTRLQCTNRISETSHTYDRRSMLFDPWMLPTTFESNKKN